MNAYVDPPCPFEGCEAETVHYHIHWRSADFATCECDDTGPEHEIDGMDKSRCYAPRPENTEPICPFEGCEAEDTHHHRNESAADL